MARPTDSSTPHRTPVEGFQHVRVVLVALLGGLSDVVEL